MALKQDRHINDNGTEIDAFMFVAQERGYLLVHHGNGGSGAAMDQAVNQVILPTGGVSGKKPAGLLLNDVVNYDLTRQHLNPHRDEVQVGSKVTLLTHGWVVTNAISGSPVAGDDAYFNINGELTSTAVANSTKVGRFKGQVDADGYAKVEININ